MLTILRQWLLLLCVGVFVVSVYAQQQFHYDNDDDFSDFDDDEMVDRDEEDSVMMREEEMFDIVEEKIVQQEEPSEKMEEPLASLPTPQNDDDEEEATVEVEDPDEFSHLTDDEEFTGFSSNNEGPSSRPQFKKDHTLKEPKITIANVPLHLRSNWDSFYLELLLLAGLLVYFTNFSIGRGKNHRLAQAWFEAHKTILLHNFALVGDDGKAVVDSGNSSNANGENTSNSSGSGSSSGSSSGGGCGGLQKESENIYSLYCSGRASVHSMMVELRFVKRQDLVSVVTQVFRPSSDEVILKLRLDDMDPLVLCLATKKTAATLARDMTDISTYCPGERRDTLPVKQYGSSSSSKFVVYSELSEATTALLHDSRTVAVLAKHLSRLNYLHVSDQYSGPKSQDQDAQQQPSSGGPGKMPEVHKMLIMSFQLHNPSGGKGGGNDKGGTMETPEEMETLRPLLMLALHLADKLQRLKLSKESRQKAERNRARVEEAFLKATHAARAEIAQAKREEKKRAERERIMEIDDPIKQRKFEEREKRRAAKRKGQGGVKLKVA